MLFIISNVYFFFNAKSAGFRFFACDPFSYRVLRFGKKKKKWAKKTSALASGGLSVIFETGNIKRRTVADD
ncbi:MAG: hypothetical protein LBD52_05025 [Prevotellaceae bacterium]|jgi:hypothetical protein|nr:hypothetical protein [Prevotellaceae bacterium]